MSVDVTARPQVSLEGRLARRAASYARSPWAAIDPHLDAHPDLIYFGSGAPAAELYPVERLGWAAAHVWERMDPHALDYGELPGYPPLLDLIRGRMRATLGVDPGDGLMVTSGSQQAMDFAAKLLLDPGDVVVVEAPTYIGALQTLDGYEPTYWSVPMDDEGLDVGALRRRIDAEGVVPKMAYVVPTFQNPTGRTMSAARRRALVDLCAERGVALVEDDPYGEMWLSEPPPAPLRALSEAVLYLGTFSKTMAPGLRVGWMAVPPWLRDLTLQAKESTDICADRSTMRVVHAAADGFLDDHVAEARALYRRRRDALVGALRGHMPPGVTWVEPDGGFFCWVTLPAGLTATELLPRAARAGAGFLPGRLFYPHGDPDAADDSLRLSFSSLPEDRIAEGIARLGTAIREALVDPGWSPDAVG